MKKTFVVLANIQMCINDEYTRSIDDIFLCIVDCLTAEEALEYGKAVANDKFKKDSEIENIYVHLNEIENVKN